MNTRPTRRQADVLAVLEGGEYTASEVGTYHLPIGLGSARSALEALERKGLATRIYTGWGNNRIRYAITKAGSDALAVLDEEPD